MMLPCVIYDTCLPILESADPPTGLSQAILAKKLPISQQNCAYREIYMMVKYL